MNRSCATCGARLAADRRPTARYCNSTCRVARLRGDRDLDSARDAAATTLLLRQTKALADRDAAALWGDAVARSAADAELREIASHVRRLFGV
ncbi:hypothetical protein [Curtobacterium luteum]|uniref:hypothetical protein n=1 Tax=Curtobacterium luteum TaxID=33881 RepID=UPI00073791C2|nr:hypothetical protein [Curtobacterium luteum]